MILDFLPDVILYVWRDNLVGRERMSDIFPRTSELLQKLPPSPGAFLLSHTGNLFKVRRIFNVVLTTKKIKNNTES